MYGKFLFQWLWPLSDPVLMPYPLITTGAWAHLDPASNLLGRVFDRDPVFRYMLRNLSDDDYQVYLQQYCRGLCPTALLNGGTISEADGWKSITVILSPGRSIDNPWRIFPAAFGFLKIVWRVGTAGRMLGDYSQLVNAVRKRILGNLITSSPSEEHEFQGKGLTRALTETYQDTAWCHEHPIWLEATTEHSRNIYLSMGFEQVEEITIGQGKAAPDGTVQKEGPTITMWAMVWGPRLLQHRLGS